MNKIQNINFSKKYINYYNTGMGATNGHYSNIVESLIQIQSK